MRNFNVEPSSAPEALNEMTRPDNLGLNTVLRTVTTARAKFHETIGTHSPRALCRTGSRAGLGRNSGAAAEEQKVFKG
jgi:hypothetical protein